MPSLVVDTHVSIWVLARSPRLSSAAHLAIRKAIEAAYPVYVSSVTIVEIIYLVEKRRLLPQQLTDLLTTLHRPDSGFRVQPFDLAIAETIAKIPRETVPDMPDRMIAATALYLDLPLVTADRRIQMTDLQTIW